MTKRVVITSIAGLSPLGHEWETIAAAMRAGRNGTRVIEEWGEYEGLNTQLGSPIVDFSLPPHYTRKQTRSMGRVAQLAVVATENALGAAGLLGSKLITGGDTGIAFGSSSGSPPALGDFGALLLEKSARNIKSTSYIKMMSHTAAVNVGMFFGIRGRVITTSTACTSGSQAIGYAYEAIRSGRQKIMIAGGAEELSVTQAAVFDTLYATSVRNDDPGSTPRPFDRDRDGLVVGEGVASFVLEDLEFAEARGASIIAEVVGFGTNCDARHVTQPTADTMESAMRLALADGELDAGAIGYVSGHGTATELGDIAESQATHAVFGPSMPISSMKSFLGHTMGACGAHEAWLAIEMMKHDWFAPTLNLENVDSRCAELDYIVGEPRELSVDHVMNNNFAFGGINTSLIFRRWS
ncbi:beta-ketoacyl-ACP synthase [Candidatus Rariloculus sp.]|uniref:beta-ketoacyl-ACP synthase n=1 Tax=Candidatus Rariloculus sp. TaxID=3101265 RepID=UPI003D134052